MRRGRCWRCYYAGVLTLGFLRWGRAGLKLRLRHFRIIPHVLKRVAKIAVPSWLENLLLWGGQTSVVLLVMGQVDKTVGGVGGVSGTTLGAHTSVLRIESLAFLPWDLDFGTACAALVGQYLGAKKPEEAERATVLCNRLAFWTMTIMAIPMVVYPLPGWLLGWVVDSRPVVEMGVIPLMIARGWHAAGFAVAIITVGGVLKG